MSQRSGYVRNCFPQVGCTPRFSLNKRLSVWAFALWVALHAVVGYSAAEAMPAIARVRGNPHVTATAGIHAAIAD